MMRLSIRARLTLWYTFALLAILALFAFDVLREQERVGLRRIDRELDALTTTITDVLRDELSEEDDVLLAASKVRDTVSAPGRALAILDEHGGLLTARWNGLALADLRPLIAPGTTAVTVETAAGRWRVHPARTSPRGTMMTVLAAAPMSDADREREESQEGMLVEIPIALLLAGGGGLWLASVGLRPINRALELQRQFMADASHELRTPIAVVRAAADVTLSRERRDEAEYREALKIIGQQAGSMGRLVEDMLVLARADAGGYPLQPVALYLDEVVAESTLALEVIARERGVTIRVNPTTEVPFWGDEDLLRRAMTNVIQNAVQHTPQGGTVTIDISRAANEVSVRVIDTGLGIPRNKHDRIFERFVQLDPARRAEGAGVGLPIARWIAEAHRGTLVLERSGPGGSTFCFTLPCASGQPSLASTAQSAAAID
jgi:signal transduction histidine kinase